MRDKYIIQFSFFFFFEQDCQLDFCPSDAPCVTSGDSNQLARQLDFDAESTSVPCNDREIEASTIMSTSQGQLLVDGGAGYTDRYISSSRSRSSRNAEEQMSSLSPCTAKTSYPTPTVTHKVTKATSPNSCDQKPIRDVCQICMCTCLQIVHILLGDH